MQYLEKNTLHKSERLYVQKRIDALFSSGDAFIAYPLRVVYAIRDRDEVGVSIMVSVSKKKFKRAVKRNRVKRLVREAYRLNKENFYFLEDKSIDVAFLYLRNELPDYGEIEKAVKKTASILKSKLLPEMNKEQDEKTSV